MQYNNDNENDDSIPQDFGTESLLSSEAKQTLVNEPRHEKTCFSHMRTTKVQISLCIHAVWSAPLLFTT